MQFPIMYGRPYGRLLLAQWHGQILGMVAMRRIDDDVCEMKRMFVRSIFRGEGIGRKLLLRLIQEARAAGYVWLRLDTLPNMRPAIKMYRAFGFVPIAPYRHETGLVYLGLRLR